MEVIAGIVSLGTSQNTRLIGVIEMDDDRASCFHRPGSLLSLLLLQHNLKIIVPSNNLHYPFSR
jgi:hypothetical protein